MNSLKLLIVAAIILLAGVASCEHSKVRPYTQPTQTVDTVKLPSQYGFGNEGYQIFVIDSCEYIYTWFGGGNGGGSLTHKGNCKFCIERNKK